MPTFLSLAQEKWRGGSWRKPDTKPRKGAKAKRTQVPALLPLNTVSFPICHCQRFLCLYFIISFCGIPRIPASSSPRFSCPPNRTVTGSADFFLGHQFFLGPTTPLPHPLHPPSPGSLGPRRPFLQEEEAGFLGNDWWGTGERGRWLAFLLGRA